MGSVLLDSQRTKIQMNRDGYRMAMKYTTLMRNMLLSNSHVISLDITIVSGFTLVMASFTTSSRACLSARTYPGEHHEGVLGAFTETVPRSITTSNTSQTKRTILSGDMDELAKDLANISEDRLDTLRKPSVPMCSCPCLNHIFYASRNPIKLDQVFRYKCGYIRDAPQFLDEISLVTVKAFKAPS